MVEHLYDEAEVEEEITLGSTQQFHVDQVDQIEPHKIDYEYIQSNSIKGITREFVVFDDIHMHQTLKVRNPKTFKLDLFKHKAIDHQHVNLTYLDPKPDRSVHIAWDWFFNGLAAIVWSFVIIYVGEYTDFVIATSSMLPVGILLGTFGIIAFMIFYYKTQDKIIYKTNIGQVPVIELFHMPRNKPYNDFIDKFEANIYRAHQRKNITMRRRLAGELTDTRKLMEHGYISNEQYEQARSRIFKHDEYKA